MAVKEHSVRAVAEAVNESPLDLLVQVGLYTEDDRLRAARVEGPPAPAPAAAPVVDEDEEAIRVIEESDAPKVVKEELIREIRRRRRQDARERVTLAEQLLELARRVRGATS